MRFAELGEMKDHHRTHDSTREWRYRCKGCHNLFGTQAMVEAHAKVAVTPVPQSLISGAGNHPDIQLPDKCREGAFTLELPSVADIREAGARQARAYQTAQEHHRTQARVRAKAKHRAGAEKAQADYEERKRNHAIMQRTLLAKHERDEAAANAAAHAAYLKAVEEARAAGHIINNVAEHPARSGVRDGDIAVPDRQSPTRGAGAGADSANWFEVEGLTALYPSAEIGVSGPSRSTPVPPGAPAQPGIPRPPAYISLPRPAIPPFPAAPAKAQPTKSGRSKRALHNPFFDAAPAFDRVPLEAATLLAQLSTVLAQQYDRQNALLLPGDPKINVASGLQQTLRRADLTAGEGHALASLLATVAHARNEGLKASLDEARKVQIENLRREHEHQARIRAELRRRELVKKEEEQRLAREKERRECEVREAAQKAAAQSGNDTIGREAKMDVDIQVDPSLLSIGNGRDVAVPQM